MGQTPTADVVAVVRGAAERVLARDGFEKVTVQTVAAEADVSRQVIYNRFGSGEALLDDVAASGFRRLGHWLLGPSPGTGSSPSTGPSPGSSPSPGSGSSPSTGSSQSQSQSHHSLNSIADPLAVLVEVFRRYRRFAMAEPELHRFLFDGLGNHGITPSARTIRSGREALGIFVAATTIAVDAGLLLPGPPAHLTKRLLAAANGAIGLEQAGPTLSDDDACVFDATLATMIRGLRPSAQLR